MQLVHQRLLALPAFVALRRRHVIGHIFGDANIMADAASRGNYVVAKELAAQLGMALQWKPHGPLLAALMRDLVTLHARATPPNTALAQTTRGASNLNMVGSPIAHLSRAPCPLGRPAPRLTACRQRTAGRHPLSAPPCTALAQTAHGMSNPNMVGSPFAHLSGTLDTSDLKTELSSPSWNHEMALSDAAPPLPYEPPWCQPAANCPASFQLAPAPPVIFPPASVAIPSVTPVASRPAADCTAGCAVAQLLTSDTSALALRPTSYNLEQLCLQLYDPTSAQPARTSNGQNSAWKHWAAWCALNNTEPWRLARLATDTDFHREAVLQAGFVRFCHVRQSARPRAGRRAALVSSALKTLCHVRKMHRDRNFPMCPSPLVTAQVRRLLFEYKAAHGVADMVPRRREPFTRHVLVDILLATPDGFATNLGELRWTERIGRSLRGLIATLAQAGFRKGEAPRCWLSLRPLSLE